MRPVPDFASPIETYLTDLDLMDRPMLNKGTAFTDEERDRFQLHGLLPPTIGDLQGQIGQDEGGQHVARLQLPGLDLAEQRGIDLIVKGNRRIFIQI